MQPHPIPQDVTSFQFHLVGDMTLKQFMYLAIGSTLAYIFFVFLTPIYPIIAWPLIIISGLSGAALAFLPVGSRPLDHWLLAFLKAVYSPTKRVWKRNSRVFTQDPLFSSRLATYLSSLQPKQIGQVRPWNAPISTNTPPAPLLTTAELGKTVDLARQAQNLKFKIIQTERVLNQIHSQAKQPDEINKIIIDLQNLVNQASQIKQQLDTVAHEPTKLGVVINPALVGKVKIITPTKPKQTQLALTTFPNVISGVIKDTTGNYLEGCIAVIYDKEGLPVRALKTNKLGQFTGSTPLQNGTYKLVIEKDNLTFDVLQIELTGELLPPLMIASK